MANIKTYRIFSIVCYDKEIDVLLEKIVQYDLRYFFIKHTKESDDKKDHYHICIYVDKPTTISRISNCLDIEPNYISVNDSFGKRYNLKSTVGYFLHYNNNEKINYSITDFQGNMLETCYKYYDILTGGSDETNQLTDIINYINDNDVQTLTNVVQYCISNNLVKTLKKYQYIINIMVREN